MKVGDLVQFKVADFQDAYGIGLITRIRGISCRVIVTTDVDDYIHERLEELELISESKER